VSLKADVIVRRNGFALDVSLEVEKDETVAVLGPNGAGKTTLLRALAGLIGIRGRIELNGRVLDDSAKKVHVPTERREVGLVFQDHALFPHMTVLQNVAFGVSKEMAHEWLDHAGLSDKANAMPGELSGGQAQRVALLRTLATRPKLLLLDEPLSALDITLRAETRRELSRQLVTFDGVRVLVTHDPLEAAALADRLVVLENGRITQIGTPAEVTAKPRSRFVADLAGVNLFRGTAGEGRVELPSGAAIAAPEAGEGDVFAVIHPRAVALYTTKPEGTPRNVWKAKAEDLDRHGERVRVRLSGPVPLVAEITPSAVKELNLAAGAEVWAAVKATEISVYRA
jgi:molybdate transport system ATP-binding protein